MEEEIKNLKQDIYKNIKKFILKELFNHRKAKEGLISVHNQLLNDVNRILLEWSKSEVKKSYVKKDLIEFVKRIKKKSKEGMDKHLCDHLLWMIEEKN